MNKEESVFRPVRYDKDGNLLSEFAKIRQELLEESSRPASNVDWENFREWFLLHEIPLESRFVEFETSVDIKPKSKKHYANSKHYKAH